MRKCRLPFMAKLRNSINSFKTKNRGKEGSGICPSCEINKLVIPQLATSQKLQCMQLTPNLLV
jgi:hypothetical protein